MNHIIRFIAIVLIVSACNSLDDIERVSVNGFYGFVNKDGDTLIPPGKYDFLNPIDEEGMILAKFGKKDGYIDIHQNILIPFIYEDLGVFSEGLAPAQKNGKNGFINRKGEVVISFKYDNKNYFYKNGLAAVKKGDKWGFINKRGVEIIPLKYKKVDFNGNDRLVLLYEKNKWAFFDNKGKQLTDFIYDKIYEEACGEGGSTFMANGLILVKKDGKYGYLDSKLKEVVKVGYYDVAEPFNNNGYAIVCKDNKFGIINAKGKIVVPLEYTFIDHFDTGYGRDYEEFFAAKDFKYALLDKNARFLTKVMYCGIIRDRCIINNKKEVIYHARIDNIKTLLNKDGERILPLEYEKIDFFKGGSVALAKKSGKYGIINAKGEEIRAFDNKSIEEFGRLKCFLIKKDETCGLVDKESGDVIIPFAYEDIAPCYYDEENRFIVKKGGLYGIVNRRNEVIIPIEYEKISNWVEYGPDEHYITKNGKQGLISREGKIVIPPIYDDVYIDNETLIQVKLNGKYGAVDWKNNIVFPIKYDEILWQWPFWSQKKIDTVYVKENGRYFAADAKGNVFKRDVTEEEMDRVLNYMGTFDLKK